MQVKPAPKHVVVTDTYERRRNATLERAFQTRIFSKLSVDLLPLNVSRFWELWANRLKRAFS
jgi:hypothetical protein